MIENKLIEAAKQAEDYAIVRRHIFDWIRDDLGVAAKLTILPQHVDSLIDRITGSKTTRPLAELDAETGKIKQL